MAEKENPDAPLTTNVGVKKAVRMYRNVPCTRITDDLEAQLLEMTGGAVIWVTCTGPILVDLEDTLDGPRHFLIEQLLSRYGDVPWQTLVPVDLEQAR